MSTLAIVLVALLGGGIVLLVFVLAMCRMAKLGEDDPTEEFIEALQKQAAQRRKEAATAQVLSIPRRHRHHVQD